MGFRGNLTIRYLLVASGLLVVLLSFIFLTASSSAGEVLSPLVPSRTRIIFPPSGRVTLPFNFDQAKILIPVRLGEGALFMMHLDNAWSTTTFTREAMEKASLRLGDFIKGPVRGIGGVSYIEGTSLIIGLLQVGELAVENLRVAVLDWGDYPADGIIGYDIEHRVVTTVDYHNRRITFTRADSETPLNPGGIIREIVPFTLRPWERAPGGGGVFTVRLQEGEPLEGCLDLGSGQSVISWQAAKELGISRFDPRLKSGGVLRGNDGRPVRSHTMVLSSLQIGSITIERPLRIYIADLEVFKRRPVVLIGNDILQHLGKLSLNYGKQQLIIYRR